ncbi:MAG TPA: GEVED domain-containing protein, partial [Thiolinea sp.]|nr:GEVED domain-containing protein [Thiolinea sp.]
AELSRELYIYLLGSTQIPAGTNSFSFGTGYNPPLSAGDEAALVVTTLGNVYNLESMGGGSDTSAPFSITYTGSMAAAGTQPLGTGETDNLLLQLGQSQDAKGVTTTSGWTRALELAIENLNGGYATDPDRTNGLFSENDGISVAIQLLGGASGSQSGTVSSSSTNIASLASKMHRIVALGCDYGDAPASYGAPAQAQGTTIRLGSIYGDAEAAAQPDANATGDDNDGIDDDDGIASFPTLRTGDGSYVIPAASITVKAASAVLHAWVDFNGDGLFQASEYAASTVTSDAVDADLSWNGMDVTAGTQTFARFRLTAGTLTDNPGTLTVDERATEISMARGEVEDYALAVAAAFPALYPADAAMEVCPIDSSTTFSAVEQAGWTHSNLSAPLDPDIPGPELSAAQPLRPGPGIVYHINATSAWVQQAGESGLNAAYLAGDYVEYEFTTNALIAGNRFLSKLRYGIAPTTTRAPYRLSALISKDPDFLSAKLIVDRHEVTAPAAYTQTRVLSINPVYLEPSTTYYLRIVFHDVTSSTGEALWDDFRFGFTDCVDYSDTPASFGDAWHKIGRGSRLFLGGTNDAEGGSIASTDAGRDGTEDDGVPVFPPLSAGMTRYPLDVTVTNSTGSGALLHGWIDMDGNGTFGADEYASVAVPDGVSGGPVTLFWPRLSSSLVTGNTFARLRLTTDALGSGGSAGTASNGEVEDYLLTISSSFTVSGRVFRDANVNMSPDAGEAGLSRLPMVLYDTVNGTCTSTYTDAGGEYRFTGVLSGNYQVYEASGAVVPAPENCGPGFAKDPSGYLSTTASVSGAFDVSGADVAGMDFGDITRPGFELDNSQTVLPNTLVVSPHGFATPADGRVSFTIVAGTGTPATLDWAAQLLLDNNCDGQLDGGDTVVDSPVDILAGTRICLLSKVLAPANASSGAQYVLTLQSRFSYGDGTTALLDDLQQHTDVIRIMAGSEPVPPGTAPGAGVLNLNKSVWNVTRNITGDVALPGEILRYTIRYENVGSGNVDELTIHDSVPAFTQLVPGSLSCSDHPPELPLCAGSGGLDGSLEWVWSAGDKLRPGSGGSVSFEVKVK